MSTELHEAGTALSALPVEGRALPVGAAQDLTGSFIQSLEDRWRLAKAIAMSGLTSYREPEACLAVMLKAHELGIPAMQGFATIHFFDGKLTLAADLMLGLAVQRCGVRMQVVVWTNEVCSLLFTRPGWEPVPAEFTIEDARKANLLGKKNWQNYPKAMLAARAKAQGVRMIAPDYFAGTYAVEEFEDEPRRAPDVAPVPEKNALEDLNARIQARANGAATPAPVPEDLAKQAEQKRGAAKAIRAKLDTLWDLLRSEKVSEFDRRDVLTQVFAGDAEWQAGALDTLENDFPLPGEHPDVIADVALLDALIEGLSATVHQATQQKGGGRKRATAAQGAE